MAKRNDTASPSSEPLSDVNGPSECSSGLSDAKMILRHALESVFPEVTVFRYRVKRQALRFKKKE